MRSAALMVLLCACNPLAFDDLRGQAPTLTFGPRSGYPSQGFGRSMATWGASLRGHSVSRIAIAAGPGSPFQAFPVFDGTMIDGGQPIMIGCDSTFPCGGGAGVSFAGLAHWGASEDCLAIPGPDNGTIVIRCEDDPSRFSQVSGPTGERLGASAAGLGDHALGRALLGAPGTGKIYLLPDSTNATEIVLGASGGGDLGSSLAAATVDPTKVAFVSGAPMAGRVVVANVSVGPPVTAQVVACPTGAMGYGASVAIGDLNADGQLDVAVGTATGTIEIFDGAALPGSCAAATPAATLTCTDSMRVTCASTGFGGGLAIGDVDGDGTGDLMAGAPHATVDGASEAGAVIALAGGASLTDLGHARGVMAHSQPSAGAHLGTIVSAAPGNGRVEVAATAPDVNRVYVFMCSGLMGDTPSTTHGPRCQAM